MQPDQQQRIMGYFIEEAKEHLSTIERGLLTLQTTIDDPEGIQELFRAAHSVKGGAAMLGLESIQKIAHRLEDYFKVLQEHPIQVDQNLESLFLKGFDALSELLEELQNPLGLTEDRAQQIMTTVEPTLQSLGEYLDQLVVEGTTGVHRVPAPTPNRVPVTSPAVVELPASPPEDSALQLIFRSDVPTRLREMLQLFKQPDQSALARQQLGEICRSLEQAGEQFGLRNWCDLMRAVAQAIANPNNTHRVLASIVIREVKQAQEQVLAGRADAIVISSALQDLLPPEASRVPPSEDDLHSWLATAEADASVLAALGLDTLPAVEAPPSMTEATPTRALEDPLGARASESGTKTGPEVGMAELNSLADLFESEVPDLDLSWEEEVLGLSEPEATTPLATSELPGDLADLLADVTHAPEPRTLVTEDLDFLDLLEDNRTEPPDPAPRTARDEKQQGSRAATHEADSFEDLLSIYGDDETSSPVPSTFPAANADTSLDEFEDLLAGLEGDSPGEARRGRGSQPIAGGGTDPVLSGLEAIFEDLSEAEPELLSGLEALPETIAPPTEATVPPRQAPPEPIADWDLDLDLDRDLPASTAEPAGLTEASKPSIGPEETDLETLLEEITLTEAGRIEPIAADLGADLDELLDAIAHEADETVTPPADTPLASRSYRLSTPSLTEAQGQLPDSDAGGAAAPALTEAEQERITAGFSDLELAEAALGEAELGDLELSDLELGEPERGEPLPEQATREPVMSAAPPSTLAPDLAAAVETIAEPSPQRQLVTDPWEVMFGDEEKLLTETAAETVEYEHRAAPTTDTLSDPTEDTLTDSADASAPAESPPPTSSEMPAEWVEAIDDFFSVESADVAPPPSEQALTPSPGLVAPLEVSPPIALGSADAAIAHPGSSAAEPASDESSIAEIEHDLEELSADAGSADAGPGDAAALLEAEGWVGELDDLDNLINLGELDDLDNLENPDNLGTLADLDSLEAFGDVPKASRSDRVAADAIPSGQPIPLQRREAIGAELTGEEPEATAIVPESTGVVVPESTGVDEFPEHLFDDLASEEELELAEIAIELAEGVEESEDIAATLGLEQVDLLVDASSDGEAADIDFPGLDQELESLALDALDLGEAGEPEEAIVPDAFPAGMATTETAGADLEVMLDNLDNLDNLDDLDALLADDGAVAAETATTEGFEDLDALLDAEPPTAPLSPALTAPTTEETDFADLESLLGDDTPSVSRSHQDEPQPAPRPTPTPTPKAPREEDEFDDLEKLLKAADETLGGPAVAANRVQTPIGRRRAMVEQTMRVPVKQLDGLSNLVGELVVSRNSLEQNQERLRQFLDNLLYQVQQLSDVGQRMRDLYERSLLEASLLSHRQGYQAPTTGASHSGNGSGDHLTGVSFDALEMDRFTAFHTLSQEMIELIVRVRESASDIEFTGDETDQITRQFRQITTQLQESLTRSRMVPFAQAADRLPRAVRDISIKCGKQADLQVEGRDTLIDKMILEQLYDPLTHLVNNAITHGIETPEERAAAGKPPKGQISIRAFHTGNQTVIAVADDGAGIDAERVKRKAIEKGLITPQEAQTMTRLDAYDLLFLPGFSTKDKADDFAGRGVGMDVVRTSLSEIRGAINTDSTLGKGTTFTIRLPLTLSISKALLCLSNRTRIAFPMDGVEDMLDVPRDRVQTNAEGQTCILWRDTLLPFRPLADLLKYNRQMGRGSIYGGATLDDDIISVVVLRSASNFVALQVDQVEGEREIVIKQLEGPVPKPIGIAGATVMGDGRIMPIADVLELIDLAMGRMRGGSSSMWEQQVPPPVEVEATTTEPTVLIVDDSITVRELLSMTFTKSGYRVEQARDGQEAWEKLRSGLPCDLVFCDIEMPRMDGLELLSRLQKDPHLSQIPIAMLTSRGADRHRQMAIQLGASGYFTKPYLEEALLDAASRMLKGEVLVAAGAEKGA